VEQGPEALYPDGPEYAGGAALLCGVMPCHH
jgi:hypothetical protein